MNKPPTTNDLYIGYGVYVGTTDWGELLIWTDREEGPHFIALTEAELTHLNQYYNQHLKLLGDQTPNGEMATTDTKQNRPR